MSIILKEIDMPKKGERYNIILLDDGSVTTFKLDNKSVYESFKNNPLEKHEAIQIPTPHGRLIDGDELRATLRRWTEDEWNQKASPVSWAYAYEDLIDLIDGAPTVLEAEGEKTYTIQADSDTVSFKNNGENQF